MRTPDAYPEGAITPSEERPALHLEQFGLPSGHRLFKNYALLSIADMRALQFAVSAIVNNADGITLATAHGQLERLLPAINEALTP